MADATANRLRTEEPQNAAARIDRLFQLAYGRSASETDRVDLAQFVEQHGLPALCRVVFNSNEFVYAE